MPTLTWIRPGHDPVRSDDGLALPIAAEGGRHLARLAAAQAGHVVIQVASPRPLRVSCDGLLGLDEPMTSYSFQRRMRAALILPVQAGAVELLVDFGPAPRHDPWVDSHCPSRNRAATMRRVAERFPDRLELIATFHAGPAPAVGLRFPPGQFHRDGITWQEVVVRPVPGAAGPPRADLRSLADLALPNLVLSTAELPGPHHEASEPEELRAGLRRIYVPIGRQDGRAPLRSTGAETRPEPELEIAGHATLRIAGSAGSASLPMPIYESLGRLAPQRAFRSQAWPEASTLGTRLPTPIVDESEAHLMRLWDEAWAMLLRLARPGRPESGLPGPFIATGSNFATSLFVWDTSFTALATAYGWRHLPATAPLDNLWSRQHDGGYIHREHDRRDGIPVLFEPDFGPNPPLLAVAELAIARLSGDLARLRAIYPAACAHHAWLNANRRLPDGTYWTTGLANGLDNSPSLGDGGYPCLTAQMRITPRPWARSPTLSEKMPLPGAPNTLRSAQRSTPACGNRSRASTAPGRATAGTTRPRSSPVSGRCGPARSPPSAPHAWPSTCATRPPSGATTPSPACQPTIPTMSPPAATGAARPGRRQMSRRSRASGAPATAIWRARPATATCARWPTCWSGPASCGKTTLPTPRRLAASPRPTTAGRRPRRWPC